MLYFVKKFDKPKNNISSYLVALISRNNFYYCSEYFGCRSKGRLNNNIIELLNHNQHGFQNNLDSR